MAQSTITNLVNVILGMKDMQLREQAQMLAREQFGLAQQGFLEQQEAQNAQHMQQTVNFLRMFGDPKKIKDPQLQAVVSQQTGMALDQVATLAENISPSIQALQEQAANQVVGSGQVSPMDVASPVLTGQTNLQMQQGQKLLELFNTGLGSMTPQGTTQLGQDLVRRTVTGEAPLQATQTDLFRSLPKGEQVQAVRIANGLALTPVQAQQLDLGWAQYRQSERQLLDRSAQWAAELNARLQAAQAQGASEVQIAQLKELSEVTKNRAQLLFNAIDSRSYQTPEGKRQFINNLNMYNNVIRRLVGPEEAKRMGIVDLPKDADLAGVDWAKVLQDF